MSPEFLKIRKFWTLKSLHKVSFGKTQTLLKMKNLLSTIFLFFILGINSQEKKEWYFLSGTGFNEVNSKTKIHFSLGAEYFISNSKSFTFRLKYFKTGINYSKEGVGCSSFFCLFSSSSKRFLYEASVLKIPVNYKWEKELFSTNLKFFYNTGFALNFTLDERYIEIKNITPDLKTINLNFNLGIGFLYKINRNVSVFTSAEIFSGNPKSEEKVGFLFGSKLRTEEALINFGIRYKLN